MVKKSCCYIIRDTFRVDNFCSLIFFPPSSRRDICKNQKILLYRFMRVGPVYNIETRSNGSLTFTELLKLNCLLTNDKFEYEDPLLNRILIFNIFRFWSRPAERLKDANLQKNSLFFFLLVD